ncbi:MAG TPA: ATP-dependent metallopeptidase FtsH/Yme1/Tma family protein [Bryobacteraceae bacterium]|jgi:ATP-dependent Zn protease|nr:ATP-dependent metallopeptidase FtsH/Yme1/Tma family protein [Bryobacteraceae bacterium]
MDLNAEKYVFFTVLIVVAGLLFMVVKERSHAGATYSQFLQQVRTGQVSKAVITSPHAPVAYSLKDGSSNTAMLPPDYRDALEAMRQKMVHIEIKDATPTGSRMLVNSIPFLVLLGFWAIMMLRQSTHGAK